MADPQYLSTDPAAGDYLSTDASAGTPLAKAPHPEAKISAAAPGQVKALPPEAVDQFGIQRGVSQKFAEKMTTPLVHPTGSDAIDSLFSPASLALMAATAGPSAVNAVRGAIGGLSESVGPQITKRLVDIFTPALVKKPMQAIGILSDLAEAYKGKAAPVEAPAAPPEAPAAPQAQAHTPTPVASPAPTGPAPVAPEAAAVASAPMSTPDAFKAALNAFDTAKVAPQAAEVNNAAMLIKRGIAPDEALKKVLGNRPPVPANPAAELAKRLGTPSEAEMNADMARRAVRGQKSLMPKYGGNP
jgi:hypothetical protein